MVKIKKGQETQFKGEMNSSKYLFKIYKEATGEWYANAYAHKDDDVFFYKWTTGKTKKAVVQTIKDFID